MKIIISLCVLFLILSCSIQNDNTFILLIQSKSVDSKKTLISSMYQSHRSLPNLNLSGNTFRFSIKNTSKYNYLLRFKNNYDTYPGLMSDDGKNLDLDFLQIINNSNGNIIDISNHHTLNFDSKESIAKQKKLTTYFKNLNYRNSINWYNKNKLINSNLILIRSHEIKYFEVFVNLPYSSTLNGAKHYDLDSINDYSVFLKFKSDTTNIKKYLTWSQLKNIEENNYKLFHGTIESVNSIPIVFVDE